MEIRISVRNLVEFILRSGDIDNRRSTFADNAMQEGSRLHRVIQRRMGSSYDAEIPLKIEIPTEKFTLIIDGRADGIYKEKADEEQIHFLNESDGTLSLSTFCDEEELYVIDEIKTTYMKLRKLTTPNPVHLAQARCYAYIYAVQNNLKNIRVRMTYCNIETEDIKYFYEEYEFRTLFEWFHSVIDEYLKWAEFSFEWKQERDTSLRGVLFPFPYRNGQKELIENVYRTIFHKKKLFIEAPTGAGKTISTVFPAIKAMERGMADRLFYLTAKTITRTVASDTFEILRGCGLKFKTVVITAKDKICPLEKTECNPNVCPYAKGHFDRINDAMYDLLTTEDSFDRNTIRQYAEKHMVCPFEMSLDMSLFSDGIICDYNYLFDPHVYLKRFFGEQSQENYLFLVDEAHNLVDRGRDMYSAEISKEDILYQKRKIKSALEHHLSQGGIVAANKLVKSLEHCNKELLSLKKECNNGCHVYEDNAELTILTQKLDKLNTDYEKLFEEEELLTMDEEIMDFYFNLSHFLLIDSKFDEYYTAYTRMDENGSFIAKLFCVNPAKNLKECMDKGVSTVLFSATLLPIQYYKELLGGQKEDFEVYAKSVFDSEKRGLYIANDVTSKYSRRSDREYHNIAEYINLTVQNRYGNYLIFFPSYSFMRKVYDAYERDFMVDDQIECIFQSETMNEADRESFLSRFSKEKANDETASNNIAESNEKAVSSEKANNEILNSETLTNGTSTNETSLLGFCVMGGIFSEGIDLKKDALIGAILVGTGLPLVCTEREILKSYFDRRGESGFDYAYRFPGMNKVLQAAGRVIRTVDDVGIVVLLDERFLEITYRRMFPREWDNFQIVSKDVIARNVERFWDRWSVYD